MPIEYVYQSVDDLPGGRKNIWNRTKPWGTGQAVLCAKDVVKEPCIVINADDYYGKEAFQKLYQYMTMQMDAGIPEKPEKPETSKKSEIPVYDICMAAFILSNTLSANGGVTRGICEVDSQNHLQRVIETYDIQEQNGILFAHDEEKNPVTLQPDQHVSMNMWGLLPKFFDVLEQGFAEFLDALDEAEAEKKEYLLPKLIDKLLAEKRAEVTLLETRDKWFGVTYKEDKALVVEAVRKLVAGESY